MNSPSPARPRAESRLGKSDRIETAGERRSRIASRIGSAIRLSAAAPIGRDTGLGKPQPGRRLAGLVEYVDRNAAARVPIASDAQPFRSQRLDQAAGDHQGAVFVKGGMVAKGAEIELQRLALEIAASGT